MQEIVVSYIDEFADVLSRPGSQISIDGTCVELFEEIPCWSTPFSNGSGKAHAYKYKYIYIHINTHIYIVGSGIIPIWCISGCEKLTIYQ